jgi:asparagine synthase (glutamine-hydrolysing)
MCGIVGRLNFDGSPVDPVRLARARDRLAHRGPDGEGLQIDGPVGLAHRRLAILDLSERGAQPMADSSGRVWITYNGEIYNFRELRSELAALGHRFQSESDTEVILAAYRQWGIECLQRLNGMFAFGLWDGERETLFLARDRLGVKPLYWHLGPKGATFASTLKPFAAYGDIPREIDEEALGLYFQLMYVPAPRSIYRGIGKLLPGRYLAIKRNGVVSEHTYWRLQSRQELFRGPEEQALEQLDGLLRSSVQLRLVSDVPLGAFLSGGIDSSTVVALMRETAGDVRTYTIGFEDERYNEAPHARAIARHLGTRHTEAIVTAADLLALAGNLPDHYDEPFADVSAIPTLALSRMTRRDVTVALSGDGGDELFCGYPYYAYLRCLDPARTLSAPIRPLLNALAGAPLPYRAKLGLRALGCPDAESLYAYMRGPLKALEYCELIRKPFPPAAGLFREVLEREVPDGGLVERYMDLDLRSYLVDDILVKVDRASMAWGLEARNPFLDYRVVEFCRSLPLSLKCPGGAPKHLLRKLLARHVPAALFERPKAGFEVPIRAWFRRELRQAVEETVIGGHLARSGYFDRGKLERLVAEHVSGAQNHESMLWAILVFERWRERHHGH